MTDNMPEAELMHQLEEARNQAEQEYDTELLNHMAVSSRELQRVRKVFVRDFPEDDFDEELMRRELVVQKRAQQIALGQTLPRKGGQSNSSNAPSGSALSCPKCSSTQVTAQKQGFGAGKAFVGGVLTGGVGLLAGFFGSQKVRITCLQCGHSWKPRK